MKTIHYLYAQDGDEWFGFLEEYPDHVIQARTLADLRENLKDLHDELVHGIIQSARRGAGPRMKGSGRN